MKTPENKRSCGLVFLIAFCLLLLPHAALSWPGLVVGISDGDTIIVLRNNREQVKIRLYGIDCPEKRQDWGNRATQATSRLCASKVVDIQEADIDRYGRTVTIIILPDSSSLQGRLVAGGLAWVWSKYCKVPGCLEWSEIESKAREGKAGLWRDTAPVTPWEWRTKAQK